MVKTCHRRSAIGGYPFAADPALSAHEQTVFWLSSAAPAVVPLVPVSAEAGGSSRLVSLGDLSNAVVCKASDGWHLLLRCQGVDCRAWLRCRPPLGAVYAAQLPFDELFELRAHAARRLWRALSGRPPGPDFRKLPAQRRVRLIQSLRALDASRDGASYRAIAAALFGAERITERGWKTHDLRNRTIRLAQSGQALMRGGYFELLRYPLRRG